jgi:PAS domain S-box-containing protein
MNSPVNPVLFMTPGLFEIVLEGVPDAILVADQDERIALVNRNAETLFGYSRTELIGKPLAMLVPGRFRDSHVRHVVAFHAHPQARPMGAGRDLYGLRKDGSEIPIEIGLNPIETPVGVITVASIIDITERQRAEEPQQQMAALVESAEDAILIKSLDGIVRSWNPGAQRLLGYRAEEIIGQPVTRLLPVDRQDEESMIIARIKDGQRVDHFETVRRRKDGSYLDVSLTISPIRNRAGLVIGASKIMRDTSERKRREDDLRRSNLELQQINKELDDFVYTASHDLRAPLTAVSALAQWILDDDNTLSAESRDRLALILARIERMKRLLNDIRAYARAGRLAEVSGPPMTAAALVADIVTTSHVPAGFSVRCDSSMEVVEITRVPLQQILHNLIGNAIKHHDHPAGNVAISVDSSALSYRFSVTDDGPGVPEEYRQSIFEMFKTLKPRDEVEGSGMGLALVRKLVGRMGGQCGVEAALPRGARFWFDWPRSGQPTAGAT